MTNQPYNTLTTIVPPTLLCDFYKTSHKNAFPKGITRVYSTLTPRSNRYMPIAKGAVVFYIQAFVQKYLVDYFNNHFFGRPKEVVVAEYERYMRHALFIQEPDSSHIAQLHDLGYLPIEVRALKEGTIAPIQVPVLTIENTHDDFYWLTNYFETIITNEIWLPMTSATFAHEFKKMLDVFAIKTTGSTDGVEFSAHDFSMRGMSSLESAMASGAGHLLPFVGTDTIPAISALEHFYGANIEKELVGTSIPATEHSVMTALTPTDGSRDEREAFKYLITEAFPNGFISLVADSYDLWKVVNETLPSLYDEIMARDGKVVIRPDSGNPADILCGSDIEDLTNNKYVHNLEDAEQTMKEILSDRVSEETPHGEYGESNPVGEFKYKGKYYRITLDIFWNRYDKQYYYMDGVSIDSFEEFTPKTSDLGLIECLWNTFGGTVNEQGYKVLDSHIGAIYGDSITYELAKEICERLADKGFASLNVVFGIGAFSYQHVTRDNLGWGMKATYAEIDGKPVMLMKDPKTDSKKKSQRGKVAVLDSENGLVVIDGIVGDTVADQELLANSLLEPVFKDGIVLRFQTLSEIRKILNK